MSTEPARPRAGAVTLLAVHLIILPTGASQALYGPSLPAVSERFGVAVGTTGLLVGAHSAGAAVGIVAWALLQRRLGARLFAAASGVALGCGSLLLAGAPTWAWMLAGAALTGVGFGGNATGLNVYVSRLLGDGSPAVLTSMAALFGVGSIAAPALLGWLGPADHPLVFAVVGITALIASPLLLRSAATSPAPATPAGQRRPTPVAVLFMVALATYVAVEVGMGGWVTTHLVAGGHSPQAGARWTAAVWGAFTVGRFLATPLALRVPPRTMAVVCLASATGVLALATAPALAPVAYVLGGLALAPVFPALYAWYAGVTGTDTVGSALFFLAGSAGAAVVPPLIGVLAQAVGARAIPLSLATLAAGGSTLLLWLRAATTAGSAAPTSGPAA